MSKPQIKAILFDLDGVLIDATEWHYEALNRALELFGYTISRYEHLTSYNGLPTRRKLEMLGVEKGLPTGLHNLLNSIKQKYTQEEILRSCTPSFEKEYMIHQLKRDGYRMGVCSNAVRNSVRLMLDASAILPEMEVVLSNEDVSKAKPDPEIYTIAIGQMGLDPSEVVIVEDADYGVQAAQAAGAHVCRVYGFDEVDYDRIHHFIEALT